MEKLNTYSSRGLSSFKLNFLRLLEVKNIHNIMKTLVSKFSLEIIIEIIRRFWTEDGK